MADGFIFKRLGSDWDSLSASDKKIFFDMTEGAYPSPVDLVRIGDFKYFLYPEGAELQSSSITVCSLAIPPIPDTHGGISLEFTPLVSDGGGLSYRILCDKTQLYPEGEGFFHPWVTTNAEPEKISFDGKNFKLGVNTLDVEILDGDMAYKKESYSFNKVNESPTIDEFEVSKEKVHDEDFTVRYKISDKDGDKIYTRLYLNDELVFDWQEGPLKILDMAAMQLKVGKNEFKLEVKDLIDGEYGPVISNTLKIERVNNLPVFKMQREPEALFEEDRYFVGILEDADGDKQRIKVYKDDTLIDSKLDVPVPYNLSYVVRPSDIVGDYLEFKITADDNAEVAKYLKKVYLKPFDSMSFSASTISVDKIGLVVEPGFKAAIKLPNPDATNGYVKEANLGLKFIKGDTQEIDVNLIKTDWKTKNITVDGLPSIRTFIQKVGPFSSGIHQVDVAGVYRDIYESTGDIKGFGVLLSSEGSYIFSSVEVTFDVQYQASYVKQPKEVYSNRVPTIEWMPYIFPEDEVLLKAEIQRSTTKDFASFVKIFESSSRDVTSTVDNSVTIGSSYYYRIKVYTSKQTLISTPVAIPVPVPKAGFKYELNNSGTGYVLMLAEGFGFDSSIIDYDFYVTPDGLVIKEFDMGNLIGGRESNIVDFEVVSGLKEDVGVVLGVYNGTRIMPPEPGNTYTKLDDVLDAKLRTKVELSTTNFNPVYPVKFRLQSQGKQKIYMRVTPQSVFSEDKTRFWIIAKIDLEA